MRAWERWADFRNTTDVPGLGEVTEWYEIIEVDDGLVTFDAHNLFPDGEDIVSGPPSDSAPVRKWRDRWGVSASRSWESVMPPTDPGLEWVFLDRRT